MKRIVPVVVLVLLVAAWMFRDVWTGGTAPEGGTFRAERVRRVEELLQSGDAEGARRALASAQGLNDAERAYGEAVIDFAGGDAPAALEHVRTARASAPAAWRPLSIEVAALMSLGRDAEVGRAVRAALEGPPDVRVMAMAAQHFATSETDRDPRRALELLDAIDALGTGGLPADDPSVPSERSLLITRYSAAMSCGAYGTARAAAERLVELASGDPSAQILAGEAARREGAHEAAIQRYRQAVERAPAARPWQEHLVQLLLETPGNEQEALDRTSAMLRTWPTERSVRVLRARALVRSEKLLPDGPDRAVTIYRGLLKEEPDDLEVLRNLALVLYDWKQGGQDGTYLDEAYALLQGYVLRGGVVDARIANTWNTLQERALERARAGGAAEPPEQAAFEAAPGDAEAAEAYRAALLAAGREGDAGQVVRRALKAAPEDPAVHVLAARHFLAAGADHDAVAAVHHVDVVTKALGGEDALPEALLWLRCQALLASQRHTEALEIAQALIALRPSAVPYLAAGAQAALALGRGRSAEMWLRDALLLEDRPDLRELLERALEGGGK